MSTWTYWAGLVVSILVVVFIWRRLLFVEHGRYAKPEFPDLHTLNKMTKEMLDKLEEEGDADAPKK